MIIVTKSPSGGSPVEYRLDMYTFNNRIRFGIGNSGGSEQFVEATAFGSPPLNTWFFVVGWHDSVAATLNIQVNNGTVNSVARTLTPFQSTGQFHIGWNTGTTWHLDGRVDAVGLWKRVLTAQERADLYNGGSGFEYPWGGPAEARYMRRNWLIQFVPFFGWQV